ncbi:MAG TPA: hypothetical protein VIM88_07050 [Sulfurovum sp.]|uniref:hypothetical protein n=1 Tax=Sulfurovum sp. TaxID=1969726 RepID=UPI002F949ED4
MRLGLYIFATLLLMAIVAAVTYTINSGHYAIEMMGINFSFPVAAWIVFPMFILFLFTLIHMFFYGLKNYFMLKKWQKDTNTLEDALYWSLVNEPKEQKYAIDSFRNSALLLGKASLEVSESVEGVTPRLSRVVSIIQKIKKGDYVDLKEEKMSKVFHAKNPILVQNNLNRLHSDDKFVEEVMRSTKEYSDEVHAKALEIFASKAKFEKARKYAKVFDVKNFLVMLKRVSPEDTLELHPEIISEFVDALNLSCEDYLAIATVTKKYFQPEENLALFSTFQSQTEKAQNAYLYLLFEYELLDQVARYLEEQDEDDFIKFRALYELKKEHHKYQLKDIIDIGFICK